MTNGANCQTFTSSTVISYSNLGDGPKVYQETSEMRSAPGGVRRGLLALRWRGGLCYLVALWVATRSTMALQSAAVRGAHCALVTHWTVPRAPGRKWEMLAVGNPFFPLRNIASDILGVVAVQMGWNTGGRNQGASGGWEKEWKCWFHVGICPQIRETRRTVRDSDSGLEQMSIGHHIRERAHIMQRSRNHRTGDQEERQDYINMDESE